jgi:hypothetical protein
VQALHEKEADRRFACDAVPPVRIALLEKRQEKYVVLRWKIAEE